jgi:ABC-type branched-subunit amino acid transport system substrate-binding protein
MKRFDPSVGSSLMTLGVIVVVAVLLSLVTIVPDGNNAVVAGDNTPADVAADGDLTGGDAGAATGDGSATAGGDATGAAGSNTGARTSSGANGVTANAKATGCNKDQNGGATDVGVSSDAIKVAATIVADGPGSTFLSPVRTGMTTVVNKANARAGAICGRRINLTLRNDSWDADRGQQFIKNFVEGDKVFALAVVPSSEGLRAADDYIQSKGVPVVGTDGMLIHQYRNPWIWPVASSTISTMHVMAKDAHDRGARKFGIVFDAKYHFGVEGAFAFNEAVKRLTGNGIDGYDPNLKSCVQDFCGIQPGKPTYSSEANQFNRECFDGAPACQFVAMLLEPDTAVSFLTAGRQRNPEFGIGGAQPLFNRSFAESCRGSCDGMWVWTGYNPPIENLANQPGVAKYVNEVRAESASADVANQFLEGGYLGMSLFVAALDKVGPNLTRANLKAVLDSMDFDAGLSSPLSWRPGSHFANRTAQAFEIQFKQTFNGWRQRTSFISDPWVGQDIPAGE